MKLGRFNLDLSLTVVVQAEQNIFVENSPALLRLARPGADRRVLHLLREQKTVARRCTDPPHAQVGRPISLERPSPRRAAKGTIFPAVCCTKFSVTTPSCRTFSRSRGVFIFVQNFSRGIFLRESLSKVVEVLDS